MKRIPVLVSMILLAALLTACAVERPRVTISGAEETAAAATAYFVAQTATAAARVPPTATPGPSPTPYVRPTDDPSIDPRAVIASVAGHEITVAEFRERVRYERWLALDALSKNIAVAGLTPETVANPREAMSPTVIGVLYTLSRAEEFAGAVLTMMIRERIMHREYQDRGLPANTALYNNLWLNLVGLSPAGDGSLPAGFETARDAYLARIAPYTAISEADLRFKLTVRSEQQALVEAMGAEAQVDPRAVNVRHILVATEDEAKAILDELAAGADFEALARERSLDENARGNGGDLGFFGRGEMVTAFEEAAFGAEVGEIVGPIQTEYGFHVIQVLEQEDAYRLQRIVVASTAEAQAVLDRLAAGEDFAALVEELSLFPADGGDIGFYSPGDLLPAWRMAIAGAEVGQVVGPLQSADGFNVLQITDRQVNRVHARHILVETEEEARQVLERLAAGEDFAALAAELSIDTDARGNGGNLGFLTADQMPEPFAEAVLAAAVGDLIGPVQTEYGYHVIQVLDSRVQMLTPDQYDEIKAVHFQNWLRREVNAVEVNEIWRQAYPADPAPADVAPVLGAFEEAMTEALAAMNLTGAESLPASE
ncbi:MAG: hypothetical protein HPY64_07560 [Anaerolineae bacterium]|nr:hypothetical protein [Anaerolineae bacterium]